jgi:acetyl-CoA acetyltransferase
MQIARGAQRARGACALDTDQASGARIRHRSARCASWARRGVAALCIGGGEATAMAIERV